VSNTTKNRRKERMFFLPFLRLASMTSESSHVYLLSASFIGTVTEALSLKILALEILSCVTMTSQRCLSNVILRGKISNAKVLTYLLIRKYIKFRLLSWLHRLSSEMGRRKMADIASKSLQSPSQSFRPHKNECFRIVNFQMKILFSGTNRIKLLF